jgi:hypothetical protein
MFNYDDNYVEVVILGKKYYLSNGMLSRMRNLNNGSFDYVPILARELATIILTQNTIILEGEC